MQKKDKAPTKIDINLDDLFEDIYKEYGEKPENNGKHFSFDDYIIKKYPTSKNKENFNYNLFQELNKKFNGMYKNITLSSYNAGINIHVTKATFFLKELELIWKMTTIKNISLIFLILTSLLILTACLSSFLSIYYTFFTLFLIISVFLFFVYGIEIILIITGVYFLTKNILLISNSIGIIDLPYIKYFDPNIYSYSLILICLIISIPRIIQFVCMLIMGLFLTITIVRGRNVKNFNDLLKKIEQIRAISEIINTKYKETIIKITTIRGFSFDFFIINKYKMFMACYMITASFCCLFLNFDFNTYYYTENNGYCSNIGNKVFINHLDKNENIVHVISNNKLDNNLPTYTFKDRDGNPNYVYETSCERGVIKYNQEKLYSTDEVLYGWAPINTKINVYGTFISKNLLASNPANKETILKVKFNNDKIFSEDKENEALVLLEIIDNKEFIVYEVIFVSDRDSIIEAKKKINKNIDK